MPDSDFHTTDLDLAAFLLCREIPLKGTRIAQDERKRRTLTEFLFQPSEPFWTALRAWGESPSDGRLVDAKTFARVRFRLYRDARALVDSSMET